VRVIGPRTLLPTGVEQLGVSVHHDMREGLAGCDVVVMLRLQNERMKGPLLPSAQEFFKSYGLTPQKLALAKPDAIVMHPGPIEPGCRDRFFGRRRPALGDPAAGHFRHRRAHGGDEHPRRKLTMAKLLPPAFDPKDLPEQSTTGYPEPYKSARAGRHKRRLGDHAGLKNSASI